MKKMVMGTVSAALVLSLAVTGAFAAGNGRGRNYVDANGDGVCDNYGTGRGQYFVDADGDGVCDNCTQQGLCPRDGSGRQNGWGRGR